MRRSLDRSLESYGGPFELLTITHLQFDVTPKTTKTVTTSLHLLLNRA